MCNRSGAIGSIESPMPAKRRRNNGQVLVAIHSKIPLSSTTPKISNTFVIGVSFTSIFPLYCISMRPFLAALFPYVHSVTLLGSRLLVLNCMCVWAWSAPRDPVQCYQKKYLIHTGNDCECAWVSKYLLFMHVVVGFAIRAPLSHGLRPSNRHYTAHARTHIATI